MINSPISPPRMVACRKMLPAVAVLALACVMATLAGCPSPPRPSTMPSASMPAAPTPAASMPAGDQSAGPVRQDDLAGLEELGPEVAVLKQLVLARRANVAALRPIRGKATISRSLEAGQRTLERQDIQFVMDPGRAALKWTVQSAVGAQGAAPDRTSTSLLIVSGKLQKAVTAVPANGKASKVSTVQAQTTSAGRRFLRSRELPFTPANNAEAMLESLVAYAREHRKLPDGLRISSGVTGTVVSISTWPEMRWNVIEEFDLAQGGQLVLYQDVLLEEGSHRDADDHAPDDSADLRVAYRQIGQAWVVASWEMYQWHQDFKHTGHPVWNSKSTGKVEAITASAGSPADEFKPLADTAAGER